MMIQFHKMHGLGNDFVLIDNRQQNFIPQSRQLKMLANRHTGIGCDQFLILNRPQQPSHTLDFEIYNADGSEARQCGNGMRCITHFLGLSGEIDAEEFSINGIAGPVYCRWQAEHTTQQANINMGVPEFNPGAIPIDTKRLKSLGGHRWQLPLAHTELRFTGVSMGNPHIVILADEHPGQCLTELAAELQAHPAFPAGINIGWVESYTRNQVNLQVVERGSGLTLACGSGACAAMAALRLAGKIDRQVKITQPGGDLMIIWPGISASGESTTATSESGRVDLQNDHGRENQALWMAGPAAYIFKGEFRDEPG